jgi:hypothetical protein
MQPNDTTPPIFPPRSYGPCGHIETRTLKNGETAYRVVVPIDRRRGSRKTTRTVGTMEEALVLLVNVQAALQAPKRRLPKAKPIPEIVAAKTQAWIDGLQEFDGSVVYYVRLPVSGQIKIGVSRNIKQRMKTFATIMDGCELLAVESGGLAQERKIHTHFADYRIPGTERFLPGPELLSYVDSLRI